MLNRRGVRLGVSLALAAALALMGCDNGNTNGSESGAQSVVPVTAITDVPTTAFVDTQLTLSGTVEPENATNKTIVWRVKSGGETGAEIIGAAFFAASPGSATVSATIEKGVSASASYTQDFTITVIDAEEARAVAAEAGAALTALEEAADAAGLKAALEGVSGVTVPTDFPEAVTSKNVATVKAGIKSHLTTLYKAEPANVAEAVNALNTYLASVCKPTAKPAVPTGLAVTAREGTLSVRWTHVFGADSYEVYTGASFDTKAAVKYGENVSEAAVEIAVASVETYYVWVKSKNSYGTSDFSEPAVGVTGVTFANIAQKLALFGVKDSAKSYPPVMLVFSESSPIITASSVGNWSIAAAAIKSAGYNVKLDFAACSFEEGTVSGENDLFGMRAIRDYLVSITLPASLTSIGASAFQGCASLVSAAMQEGITSIGSNAFSGCAALAAVSIPASVTTIGDGAFSDCAALSSLVIPDNVVSVGASAFSGCAGLSDVTIGAAVVSIGDRAFSGCAALAGLVLPESVQTIGKAAFYKCSSLSRLDIPLNVTAIGSEAFSDCTALSLFAVAEENTAYFAQNGVLYKKGSPDTIFAVPRAVVGTVIIPGTVTTIGEKAFADCALMTSVTIPDTVTRIEELAFSGCTGLNTVIIPVGLVPAASASTYHSGFESLVPASLVSASAGLTVVLTGSGSIAERAFYGYTRLISVDIPETVTAIEAGAFALCSGLSSLALPPTMTSIGSAAFDKCTGLKSITVPAVCVPSGSGPADTTSAASGFGTIVSGYSGLSVTLTGNGNGAEVAEYAFYKCSGLAALTLQGVETLGAYSFYRCTALVSAAIPDSVSAIGNQAFYACTALARLTIGASVTSIGESAFKSCTALTVVTIPEKTESIGVGAFQSCNNLTRVTFMGSNTSIKDGSTTTFPSAAKLLSAGGATVSNDYMMLKGTYTYTSTTKAWTYKE